MATPYVFVLDGYTFPRADVPARGPIEEFTPQRWTGQNTLGTSFQGRILTLMGTDSQEWDLVSRASSATKDKLIAVHNAGVSVVWLTPQNPSTGLNVILTELRIDYLEPIESSKYLCNFTLVRR